MSGIPKDSSEMRGIQYILIVIVPLLVLAFNIRNNFPVQNILVDLCTVSVRLNADRGKTTNWMHGRVNGTELPVCILAEPIIRRPANLHTRAEKLEVSFRQFNVRQHPSIHFTNNDKTAP
jgi:hypothetical protein